MSSKKSKAKVSQADLRKMMQQMKNKKQVSLSNNASSHSIQKMSYNNGSNHLKRKMAEEYFQEKIEQKKLKATKVVKDVLPEKSALKKDYETQTEIEISKSSTGNVSNKRSHSAVSKLNGQELLPPQKKMQKVKPTGPKINKSIPLISGFYSGSSSSSDEDNDSSVLVSGRSSSIFNNDSSNVDKTKQSSVESSLPAGFFDDPETDAKIRGVETPADKMDREWEAFQKELQHETVQSEQLIEEEQDTGHLDREIDEIDEQIQYYNRIDKLCDKKDKVFNKVKHELALVKSELPEIKMEVDSSSDEDDALDWREKDAFT